MRNLALTLVGLIILLVVLVNLTPVQNYIARKGAQMLADKLKTKVAIKHIRVDFLNHLVIQGLYIEDQARDTLLYAGEAEVRISDWFIFRKDKPILRYIGLHDAYAHLYRTHDSKIWNYQFISDAFSVKGKKDTSSKPKEFELDLKKVDLQHVQFHMDDAWGGEDMDFDVGNLQLDAKNLDFKKKVMDVNEIDIDKVVVSLHEFTGGKPPKVKSTAPEVFDSTAFNPDKWVINLNKLSLKQSAFNLKASEDPAPANLFDAEHLYIKNINIDANNIHIIGDTIHGNIAMLHADERSGLSIKKMAAKVTVSPNASICDNLDLETNNSKLKGYYAMLYKHFPDFTSYITNVTMEARLKDAVVDDKDIAYFAPVLRQYPTVVHVTGNAKGTVADISAHNLYVSDGITVIKGDIRMAGLPDIYKTKIQYTDGEFITNGKGILKYAPDVKNDIALDKITYAYFKGSYTGYIENFAVNGVLTTNLGTLTSNVKMDIPAFKGNSAVYSGTINGDKVNLGVLLNQPELGIVSLKGTIGGNAFDPEHAQIKYNGTISALDFHGYRYQNIIAEGTLAKKQFNGTVQVNDPNLALAFDGTLDFSQKLVSVHAKANLLHSDFKALKLTSDTLTAVADFDLGCTGSSIDNFTGFAKLYNIDVHRNHSRLNIDSVYLSSTDIGDEKTLAVTSNGIEASIEGKYQLSKLPASFMYYLSRYAPNYITPSSKSAPEQDMVFSIATGSIDSLLKTSLPFMAGFDSSIINGSLNTQQQKLGLHVKSPYGKIGAFRFYNIDIIGDGNINSLALNGNVDNVSLADSALNGSLSLTATIGNDSLDFNIATSSPDINSAVTLNGNAYARRDSIYLFMHPSQFYLNQSKWDINGGSRIVYSTNYLLIKDLVLQSGFQKITVNSQNAVNDQGLTANTENLDISQLGNWAGLSGYQPDGRINGTIKVDNLFGKTFLAANIKATDVKFGADTLGTIDIIGTYDNAKGLVVLDPQTGVTRGASSIKVAGSISFDTLTKQKLDGNITFTNAPAGWTSPFLIGFLSEVKGTLNGNINFSGTSVAPDINGNVNLKDAAMKVDFLGTYYTIPNADIGITERTIDIGRVEVFDRFKNSAILSGRFPHNRFKDMRMSLKVKTPKLEVLNLAENESNLFYGNLIAGIDSMTIRGHFNDIKLHIYNAAPAEKSQLFIPIGATGVGTYTYVSFKNYGKAQEKIIAKNRNKLTINIDARLNPLAEMVLVLDPSTGDAISARGTGNIQMTIPPNNDIRMYGKYEIQSGQYSYTFRQLLLKRIFKIDDGSSISFNGLIGQTTMNVDARYTVKTRLYDLLSDAEKASPANNLSDAQTPQNINVLLHMSGSLKDTKLGFDVDLEDNHSMGTYAYTKLQRINQDDRQKLDQVASLLLIGDFIPPEGLGTAAATSGALNNVGQILSGTASSQLTNLVNKISKNKDLAVDLRYQNYNATTSDYGGVNRSQLGVNVRKNYFHDKLIVELGGVSDWGKPTSSSNTNTFNVAGDFRIQLLLNKTGAIRLSGFRTSDYDVTLNRDIIRSGAGISWRKSFDGFTDFFHGQKFAQDQLDKQKDTTNVKGKGTD